MARLKELSSIIHSLSEEEVKVLQRYLHCFDTVNESHEPKGERLLNLIIHNNPSELKLFEKKFTKQAFSMLVLRLYEKVLDTLIFDINIKKTDVYSDIGIAKIGIRKRILYTQALNAKSNFAESIPLYQKNITVAKDFELYDELLISMYELQNIYAALSKKSDFDAIAKEIKHYEEVRINVKEATQLYNKFTMNRDLYPEDSSISLELESILPDLKKSFHVSQSSSVGWFYYRLYIEYCQAKQKYLEGYTACNSLLTLQKENQAIRSESYMAITYKWSATFSIFLYDFDQAIISILKSQNIDRKIKRNYQLGKLTEFHANFHKGNLAEAQFIIDELISKTEENESFQKSKYYYLGACCSFLSGEFGKVFKQLSETKEVEKDKEGWNIAVRILGIMHQIENGDFDLADSRIESMRKHIERTMKEKDIRPRYVIILRILRDLVNSSFEFDTIWKTRQNYFDLLRDDSNETHRWRIWSPEVVRFDIWFEAKATGKSYQDLSTRYFSTKRNEYLSKVI